MINDKNMLPEFVLAMSEMKELLNAIQPEIDRIEYFITALLRQLIINDADMLLERYEQIYNLNGAGLTIEERRKNLLAKENAVYSSTRQNILNELKNMTGLPVEITEIFDQDMFTVNLIQNNLSDEFVSAIRNYLDMVKPAHIAYLLSLVRYEETKTRIAVSTVYSKLLYMKEVS